MFLELPGRVALVTGAARGIGLAIAERLSQAGASVVVADIAEEGAAAAVERLREGGGKAAAVADVTSTEEVGAIVERALEAFDGPLWEIADEDWEKVLGLNLTATFYCCRAAVPHMRERRSGAIVNVASIFWPPMRRASSRGSATTSAVEGRRTR